jgi:hypothetical protein
MIFLPVITVLLLLSGIRDEGCGILVDDLSEIPRAASKILADYANYSSRAYRAFEKYCRFEANFQKALAALNELN